MVPRVLLAYIVALGSGCSFLLKDDPLSGAADAGAVATSGAADGSAIDSGPTVAPDATTDGAAADAPTIPIGGPDANDSAYAAVVLADGPAAYFRFLETTTPIAFDSSGHGVNGTFKGNVVLGAEGAVGPSGDTSVQFAGGYVDVGDHFSFVGNTAFTVEAWIRPTFDEFYHSVFSRDDRNHGPYEAPTDGYNLTFNPGSPEQMYFNRLNAGGGDLVSTTSVPDQVWTYVAVTYDGVSLRLYLNGQLAEVTGGSIAVGPTVSSFVIGGDTGGPASQFNGLIDEVAVYEKALPTARVMAHYQAAGLPK